MGRQSNPIAQYQVKTHVVNGYTYASTQPPLINTATGQKYYRHIHWGTIDENLKFEPGTRFLLASPEEREQLIFPDEWDISEAQKYTGLRAAGRPAYDGEDLNRLYGDVWLLEQVAQVTGVRHDLEVVFDGNRELVDDILTLSMFPYLTRLNYNNIVKWQRYSKAPTTRELTPSIITRLTQSITESDRMEFLKLRAARLGKDELCAVDSTSRSAYGNSLADIHYGRNKEGLSLEQTTEAVVYTLTNHMPIYYRTFPGNMNDSRSLSTMLTDLDHAGFKDLILITDRGYESVHNLDQYILRGQKFISCAKIGGSEIAKAIKKISFSKGIPTNMNFDTEKEIYYKQLKSEHKVERPGLSQKVTNKLNINLYFDPYRHLNEIITLQKDIISQQKSIEELIESKTPIFNPAQVKKEHSYFNYVIHPKKNIIQSFTLNDDKVSKVSDQAGFFSIKTHGIKFSAMETYKAYRLRDEQEKFFNVMKTQMLADRQRNSSEDGKTGRLFILFIALILISYIRNIWKTTKLHDIFPTSFDLVHEMRSIRCIEHTNRARVLTPFVGGQMDICEAFGFEVPKGCAPTNAPSQKSKRKRGRPSKRPIERDL